MNDTKKVLIEFFYTPLSEESGDLRSLLSEQEIRETESGGPITLAGRLQHADLKNGNGRIYPLDILAREIEAYKRLIAERRSYGELDHPDRPVVEFKTTSHMITHIEMRGKEVVGKLRILEGTPMGDIAAKIYRSGGRFGISSRGLGSIKETRDGIIVQDDFSLICFDLVTDPSTPNAFLSENKNAFLQETKFSRVKSALQEFLR